MNKTLSAIMLFAVASTATAQIAETGAPVRLLKDTQSELYNPILSADGQKLLYSAADYSNLRLYDFNDNVSVTVSKESRSGLDAQFTPDGKAVVFVDQNTGANGMAMRQVKKYDIAARKTVELSEASRFVGRPVVADNSVSAVVGKKKIAAGKKLTAGVRTEGTRLFITVNGVETAYTPVTKSAGYVWASMSPDGSKVMFFAAGHGIVITDLRGNIISEPGNFEAPVWYDNDVVVAMNATDDGHQLKSSQIVMLRADGSEMQELTRPESMSMNPTASAAAGKIVYNTIDGRLYEMNIKIR